MAHIHTQPNQHDMTVSAWIVRRDNGTWKCLVHFHKKMDVLMQIGGHIELDETPWQAIAHELEEEAGYRLDDLNILQVATDRIETTNNIVHPVPFSMNTHNVGDSHYHSDLCYGFVSNTLPTRKLAKGESSDLRWLTIVEIKDEADKGGALSDVAVGYEYLIDHLDFYHEIPANSFSLEKPEVSNATYRRGRPGKQ